MVSTTGSAEAAGAVAAAVRLGAAGVAGVAGVACPQASVIARKRPSKRREILITYRIAGATMASDGPHLVSHRSRHCPHYPESSGEAQRAESGGDRGVRGRAGPIGQGRRGSGGFDYRGG